MGDVAGNVDQLNAIGANETVDNINGVGKSSTKVGPGEKKQVVKNE